MALLPKPEPQFLKLVDKPENASSSDIAKARPVYIDGLPAGDSGPVTIADVAGLQAALTDLEDRIAALETTD